MDLKPKPYTYNTSLVLKKLFEEHVKLYNGYVTKLNEINNIIITEDILENASSMYSEHRSLKVEEAFCTNAIFFHELFFDNITKENKIPSEYVIDFFNENYNGGFCVWEKEFIATAKSSRGWALFGYNQVSNRFSNVLSDTHDNGIMMNFIPIIVLDLYEHSYFADYYTDKSRYIDTFMQCINWEVIETRLHNSLNIL